MGEATRERLRAQAEAVWAELFDEPPPQQFDDASSWQRYLRTEREEALHAADAAARSGRCAPWRPSPPARPSQPRNGAQPPLFAALHQQRAARCSPPLLSMLHQAAAEPPWVPNDASASAGGAAPTPRNSCVEPARVELPARRASPHERSPAASSSNQFGAAAADAAATAGWALHGGLRGSSSDPSSLPFTTVLGAFGARSAAYSEVQETSLGWCTAQRLRMQESYGATGDGLGAVEHDSAAPATAAADGMDDELGAPYNGEPLHSTHMQMHDRQFDDRLLRTVRARAILARNSPCAIMPHRPAARQVPEGGESTTDGAESSGAPESSADRDTLFSMSPNFSSSRQGSRTSSCQSTSRKSAGIPSARATPGSAGGRSQPQSAKSDRPPLGGWVTARGWESRGS